MELKSNVISKGEEIPKKYTKDGENMAPLLSWTDPPLNVEEYVLVFESISPITQPAFTQWLVYGIPPETSELPEGFKHKAEPEEMPEIKQGRNDNENVGYDGPVGVANKRVDLRFVLYALDKKINLQAGATRQELDKAISSHVIEQVELSCSYTRSS